MNTRIAPFVVVALFVSAPALAQTDLAGVWAPLMHEDQPERGPGPEIGDYLGLPITAAMRLRAESWDASILTVPEHRCKPHPSTYGFRGVGNLRITTQVDDKTQSIIKLHTHIQWQEQRRDIWMDGRPHPPEYAAHTWAGFSTGRWDGNSLEVVTSHLKVGWLQRNGVAHSDRATMTERFIRHGNYLTVVTMVDDPIYLEEPFIRTTNWVLNPDQEVRRTQFDVVDEVAVRRKGEVPHYLPGSPEATRKLTEFSSKYKLPAGAARGGAASTYPKCF